MMSNDIRSAAVQAREALEQAGAALAEHGVKRHPNGERGCDRHVAAAFAVEAAIDAIDAALAAAPAPQPTLWAKQYDDGTWAACRGDLVVTPPVYPTAEAALYASPAPQDGPALTTINDLAKVYCTSYASPHHITFTVEGLRNLFAAIQQEPK